MERAAAMAAPAASGRDRPRAAALDRLLSRAVQEQLLPVAARVALLELPNEKMRRALFGRSAERGRLLPKGAPVPGDMVFGLPSSGVHSNGFSLVRRLASDKGWKLDRPALFDQNIVLIDALMTPTRIYVKSLLPLVRAGRIHAMAHITGGGLPGNLPRVLPDGAQAIVNESSWEWPELFKLLQREGGVEQFEMYRTFNCGVGMVIAVDAADAEKTVELLTKLGEKAWNMGHIVDNAESVAGADEKIRVIFA